MLLNLWEIKASSLLKAHFSLEELKRMKRG
jgi:hypothetical protein